MKTTKSRTWTLKYETMSGVVKTAKIVARTEDEAVKTLCREATVGNLLGLWQGRVRWW